MKDIEVKISKETRMVDISKSYIGNESENLQGNIIFSFKDGFVDGIATLEILKDGYENSIIAIKENEKYKVPIKSVMTKEGNIDMQLVITEQGEYSLTQDEKYLANKIYFSKDGDVYIQLIQGEDYEIGDDITTNIYEVINIPIFKSNIFFVYCNRSLNIETMKPDEYPSWIVIANQRLIEIEQAISQAENVDIDATRVSDGVEITITNKNGETKTVKVNDGQGGSGGTGDYEELENKPQINGVTLSGDKSLSDLGIDQDFVKDTDYVHTDNNFTDADVEKLDSLENYDDTEIREEITTIESKIPTQATSSNQLADKDFVNSSIATNTAYFRGTYESTSELPTTGNTPNDYAFVIIYDETTGLVKQYDRYKWNTTWIYEYTLNNSSFTANQWEAINSGITSGLVTKLDGIDLTDYVKNTDYASGSVGGVIRTTSTYASGVTSSGQLRSEAKTYAQYESLHDNAFIAKGTLDNVIEGKGLVSNNDLADYVKNTDYATTTSAGIIRASSTYGTQVSGMFLQGRTRTYEQYGTDSGTLFICKGTLENIIAGKAIRSTWTGTQEEFDALTTYDDNTDYRII